MRLAGRQSIPKTNFYLLKVRCCFSKSDSTSTPRHVLDFNCFKTMNLEKSIFARNLLPPIYKFQELPRGLWRRPPKDPSKDRKVRSQPTAPPLLWTIIASASEAAEHAGTLPPTLAQWPLCHLPATRLIHAACLIVHSIGRLG
jgi:hypothetical protein